eukprot:6476562-Amphidinium_carterae.1
MLHVLQKDFFDRLRSCGTAHMQFVHSWVKGPVHARQSPGHGWQQHVDRDAQTLEEVPLNPTLG